ncbi:MAG: hypothetical protein GC129_03455 [Proteobacteria bacterium]|nr:hypothetical protein [Pseudomonadota bacterium]
MKPLAFLPALLLPALAHAATAATSASPVPELLQQARDACTHADKGNMQIEPNFITRPDLNADGTPDIVVDYKSLSCPTSPTLWATPAGSRLVVFVSSPTGWNKVMDTAVQKWQSLPRNGQTQLKIEMQPAAPGAIPQAFYIYQQNGQIVRDNAAQ